MTTHQREFLARVLPWGDQDTYKSVHWATTRLRPDGKPYFNGRAVKSLDEVLSAIQWASRLSDVRDMYICMSSQVEAEQKTSQKGHAYHNPIRSQANVARLKSLYVDIDVKPGAYASTQEAAVALATFLSDTGMPSPSAVVATGSGGLHAHWALSTPLTRDEWQPLANALARALRDKGVHCDTQCTIDSARILRIPGTFNYKSGEPKPVELLALGDDCALDAVRKALEPWIEAAPAGNIALPPRPGIAANDDLTSGVTKVAIVLDDLAHQCGFVREALATGGAAYHNPLWFLTTSLATFTVGGRADAHRMANGHPGYTQQSTDELYDRVMAERQKRDIGWPQCDKIELSGCTACATCPLKAQRKSPLNFARPPAPPSTMPDGFAQDANGYVYRLETDLNGLTHKVQLCPYPMEDAWLQDNPWVLHFTTRAQQGRKTKVEAPLELIAPKDGVQKVFAKHGLMLRDSASKPMREFLVAWIQKLQQSKDAVVSSTPFGWTVANGKIEGFTYGGRVWSATGDRPAASPDPILSMQYAPKGDLKPWIDMSKVITDQQRPDLNAVLAAAFAGPLVRFTGESGVMMNVYSPESGIGKTTVMRVAQAVWADPVKAMQSLDDTPLSVLRRIGELKNLPMFWDELKTDQQTTKFVAMSFQLTGGKERSRLNADVTQRDPGTWQTMLVSASNESILDAVNRATKSTTAGVYRTFEYVVTPGTKGQIEQSTVSRMLASLIDNYGNAGLEYAKFLGVNHARIAKEIAALQDQLSKELNTINEERFWLATITIILSGALYANEIGLTDIDIAALKEHLVAVLGSMRGEIQESPTDMRNQMSVSTILAQFINAMRARHMVITNKVHVGAGKPPAGSITILSDTSRLDGIYVQLGRDDGLMRISSTYFSRWMAENGYSRHAFTKALKDEFGMTPIRGKICSGTDKVGGMEYLMELNLNDPKLAGFIE